MNLEQGSKIIFLKATLKKLKSYASLENNFKITAIKSA